MLEVQRSSHGGFGYGRGWKVKPCFHKLDGPLRSQLKGAPRRSSHTKKFSCHLSRPAPILLQQNTTRSLRPSRSSGRSLIAYRKTFVSMNTSAFMHLFSRGLRAYSESSRSTEKFIHAGARSGDSLTIIAEALQIFCHALRDCRFHVLKLMTRAAIKAIINFDSDLFHTDKLRAKT